MELGANLGAADAGLDRRRLGPSLVLGLVCPRAGAALAGRDGMDDGWRQDCRAPAARSAVLSDLLPAHSPPAAPVFIFDNHYTF